MKKVQECLHFCTVGDLTFHKIRGACKQQAEGGRYGFKGTQFFDIKGFLTGGN